jgi:hypothetical protein
MRIGKGLVCIRLRQIPSAGESLSIRIVSRAPRKKYHDTPSAHADAACLWRVRPADSFQANGQSAGLHVADLHCMDAVRWLVWLPSAA